MTTQTTQVDLDELESVVSGMTRGTWTTGEYGDSPDVSVEGHGTIVRCWSGNDEADARGIAALRNAFPALRAELRALRAVRDAARVVHIVTTGCYSDRAARGVYSDEETAHRVAKFLDRDDGDVITMAVDAEPGPREGWKRYGLTISFDGQVSEVDDDEYSKELATECDRRFDWVGATWPKTRVDLDSLRVTCWAESVDHAIKIANEQRVRWLATNALSLSAQAVPRG